MFLRITDKISSRHIYEVFWPRQCVYLYRLGIWYLPITSLGLYLCISPWMVILGF